MVWWWLITGLFDKIYKIHIKLSVRQRKEIITSTTGCGWGGDGLAPTRKRKARSAVKFIIFLPGKHSLNSVLNKVEHSSGLFSLCWVTGQAWYQFALNFCPLPRSDPLPIRSSLLCFDGRCSFLLPPLTLSGALVPAVRMGPGIEDGPGTQGRPGGGSSPHALCGLRCLLDMTGAPRSPTSGSRVMVQRAQCKLFEVKLGAARSWESHGDVLWGWVELQVGSPLPNARGVGGLEREGCEAEAPEWAGRWRVLWQMCSCFRNWGGVVHNVYINSAYTRW